MRSLRSRFNIASSCGVLLDGNDTFSEIGKDAVTRGKYIFSVLLSVSYNYKILP